MGRFTYLTDIMTGLFRRSPFRASLSSDDNITDLCNELLSGKGEVSGRLTAQKILRQFQEFTLEEKLAFFQMISTDMDLDAQSLLQAANAYQEQATAKNYKLLSAAAEPRRQELLRRLNEAPGATLELVRMRNDLLKLLSEHPELKSLDIDFVHLFRSWFNRGFLTLMPIDWDTPANILEKIIEYEAVHTINDWSELKRRLLPPDRRCYAYFHPAILEEPLIFVEIALCKGVPNSIQELLAENRIYLPENEADTAVFYSISNCQEGLRGISFGNSLIKNVVEELRRENPQLKTFVTLSPIPGLNRYLKSSAKNDESENQKLINAAEQKDIEAIKEQSQNLIFAAADYLVNAKDKNGAPLDPVARFHLGNGAEIYRVNALADISENGIRQSSTAMVNYLYDLDKVSDNHEAFAGKNTVITSKEIQNLLIEGTKTRA